MSTTPLRESLGLYAKVWPKGLMRYPGFEEATESQVLVELDRFLTDHPDALERSCVPGHITGSALVVNPSLDRVLLTLHAKLGKWLQLGGHADGEADVAAAALREAREESGREEIEFFPWEKLCGLSDDGEDGETITPIDCDIHEIPGRGSVPSHLHYDVRYLCVLDDELPLHITAESKDLRWLALDEACALTSELSMLRQFKKLQTIKQRLVTVAD